MSVEMAGMERDELLIDAVRSYPCIYDIGSPKFKVALMKRECIESYCGDLAPSSVQQEQ